MPAEQTHACAVTNRPYTHTRGRYTELAATTTLFLVCLEHQSNAVRLSFLARGIC